MTNVMVADVMARALAAITTALLARQERNACQLIASMVSAATTIAVERVTRVRRRKKAAGTTVFVRS